MIEEILFKWIPSVGFPIAIAVYVLVRQEPRLNKINTTLTELKPLAGAIAALTLEIAKMNGRKKE